MGAPGVIGLYWLSLDGCSWSNWFILAFTGWVLLEKLVYTGFHWMGAPAVIGLYWLSLDGCSCSNWFILAFTGWVLLQ